MTEAEKEQVRERADELVIRGWGYCLTAAEKRRLLERSDREIGE